MREIFSALNWADFIIIIVFIRGAYVGYKTGLFRDLLTFMILICAFFSAYEFGPPFGENLSSKLFFLEGRLGHVAAGLLIGLLVAVVLRLFCVLLIKAVKGFEGSFFAILGLLSGIVRMAFVLSALFMAVNYMNLGSLYADLTENSYLGLQFVAIAPATFEYFSSLIPDSWSFGSET